MNQHFSVYDLFDTEGTVAGLTIGATATALTKSIYMPSGMIAKYALLTVETDQIRWWADGSTPTATWGHLSNIGDVIELHGANQIINFSAIRVSGNALLQVSYGR